MGHRYAECAAMYWLPPRELEKLRDDAVRRGLWEDKGDGYISKRPKKKQASVQFVAETGPDDEGRVRLRVLPQNAGPAPRIYYAEDGPASERSTPLLDQTLTTTALRVSFFVRDPSGQYESAEPVEWSNELVLRNHLREEDGERWLELLVAPKGTIRYSLDGSEPREGIRYEGPFRIGDDEVTVSVFAEAEGLEARNTFMFPALGRTEVTVDPVKPSRLVRKNGGAHQLDSRTKAFQGLKMAADKGARFEGLMITVGQGAKSASLMVGEMPLEASFLDGLLTRLLEPFPSDAAVALTFRKAHFESGFDLQDFASKLGLDVQTGDVEQ